MARTITLALALTAFLAAEGCSSSSSDPKSDVLKEAEQCSNLRFKSRPDVVWADPGDPAPNGDNSIQFAADIPSADVDSFKSLSNLPPLTPGSPDGWIAEQESKHKELAEALKASSPTDFQHVYNDRSGYGFSRLVVLQEIGKTKERVYVSLRCW